MSKWKNLLARNLDYASEWSDLSIHGLLLQSASTVKNPIMRVKLVQSRDHNHLNDIELVLAMTAANCPFGVKQQSLTRSTALLNQRSNVH